MWIIRCPNACLVWLFILFCYGNLNARETSILQEVQVYKTIGDLKLKAHVFRPKDKTLDKAYPALAFFHGGGWVFGKPDEFFEACRRFARKGFVAVSFQYRLSINADGSYPHPDITPIESVKDVRSAMRWLRKNTEELGIDADRIVAGGQSAGGQLALSTALTDSINEASDDLSVSTVPAAILLYSSCVNTMEAWIDNLLGDRRKEIWSISPYHNLRAGMPPVLAFHGREDSTVPVYTIHHFRARMKELGNDFEFHLLPERDHYLGGPRDGPHAGYFDEGILE